MQEELLDSSYIESQELNHAKFWRRFLALFIDGIVYSLFGKILILAGNHIYLDIIGALMILLYKPTMEYAYGATLGKMAFRLRVVATDLKKATLMQVILRDIFNILNQIIGLLVTFMILQPELLELDLSFFDVAPGHRVTIHDAILCVFIILDATVYTFNTRHQALHDIMGKTYVIQT